VGVACEPAIDAVYSSLPHGPAGPLRLLLSDGNNIECRQPGVTRLEFETSSAMDGATVVSTNVSASGEVSGSYSGTVDAWSTNGVNGTDTQIAVTFDPALDDEDCWTIDLTGMTGGVYSLCNPLAYVRTIAGDVNRSGSVTTADPLAVKIYFGLPIDETNCQYDFDTNGTFTTGDSLGVKIMMGRSAPACP
jgi:hypothetical protein